MKDRGYTKQEVSPDNSSSDENIDPHLGTGGTESSCCIILRVILSLYIRFLCLMHLAIHSAIIPSLDHKYIQIFK